MSVVLQSSSVSSSKFDRLTVDDSAKSLAVLNSFLALAVQEVLFAADLHGEQVRLLKCLDQFLLVLQFANFRDFDSPRTSDAGGDSHSFAIFMELNLTHSRSHNGH